MSNPLENNARPEVTIYTDGACSGNPGPGGWGAVLMSQGHEKSIYGGARETTNNRMELQGVIEALNALKTPCQVNLYTDSKYVQQGITLWMANWQKNGWKTANKQPVKNQDLWMALQKASERHHIKWHWVKGHAGDINNEKADVLARMGVMNPSSTPIVYTPD